MKKTAILAIICVSAVVCVLALPVCSSQLELVPPPPRSLISINGDNEFTSANGVNGGGSGTQNDPYIIENRVLDASSAYGTDEGIWIKNTTKYFVIRNCLVKNCVYGIWLDNVINGKVENNTCESNSCGIYLYNSSNNIITLNYLLNNSNNANEYICGTNYWDSNGKGNYWSDWQPPVHPDNNGDEIVDEPKLIAGGTNADHYPLVSGYAPFPWGPAAVIIVVILAIPVAVFTYRKLRG